jgi:glycosyltransferase involved in cell wall biosynthesis
VHNTYQQPGGEDVVFALERRLLEEAGHQVATYCRSNWEVSASGLTGRLTWAPRTIWSSASRQAFARLLTDERPDLVHVHNTFFMMSPSIYSACREAQVPVVQTLHNFRLLCPGAAFFRHGHVCEECAVHSVWRGVRHACYRDSRLATGTVALMLAAHRLRGTWTDEVDAFIALTDFARRKFIAGGLPQKRIHVLPNFTFAGLPRPGEGDYGLFVGRLAPEKGLGTLLAAWALLPRRVPLVIVGDGPLRAELERQAALRGLSQVLFRGRLDPSETHAAMRGAKFLILASECYENFPMTVVEAFACGLPAICCRLGALPDIVKDGETGLHFTPGNPADLAAKVEWAWTHLGEMRAMGMSARAEFESKYTAEQHYSMLMEIYAAAMHPGTARGYRLMAARPSGSWNPDLCYESSPPAGMTASSMI